MQAFLLNFGDNTRVVNDSHNAAVSIGIGEMKECDIHDVHYHMIRRGVASETLLVVPKDVKRSEKLNAIMTLMTELNTEAYDDVLAKYNLLDPHEDDEAPKIRPTRDQIRHHLRDMARQEVAAALKLQSKVTIHEQGDEVTRKPAAPDMQPPARNDGPTPTPDPKTIISPDARPTAKPEKKAKAVSSKKPKKAPKSSAPKRHRERL